MPAGLRFSFNIEFVHPPVVWMLRLGGWNPIPLTNVTSVLIDRNVLATLKALARHPGRTDLEAEKWWLNHLNHPRFVLNPVLCALEGKSQRTPTFDEFSREMEASCEVLTDGLPNARLLRHESTTFNELYTLVRNFANRRSKEASFLLAVSPLLTDRVAGRAVPQVEAKILREAKAAAILSKSLAVLCALSCLYELIDGSQPSIGRRVLKLKKSYSSADAYNAVADLQCLEFLAAAIAFPSSNFGLVTRDKYLAALWCELRISDTSLAQSGGLFFNLSPSVRLFPRLSEDDVAALITRMAALNT
jgi:hypothetical protein